MVMSALGLAVPSGTALGVTGLKLQIGIVTNFLLGALMTLGIGLYAPCLILISLLGMDPKAAFPIMMGSCAFLMPVCSVKFIRKEKYDLRAALGPCPRRRPCGPDCRAHRQEPSDSVRPVARRRSSWSTPSTTMLRSAASEAAATRAKTAPAT
jgi:hypothetical protein